MVVILKAFKVLYDKAGKKYLIRSTFLKKWKNDEFIEFGLDVHDPVAMRKFLANYRDGKGKKFPNSTPAGDPLVYSLYNWGAFPQEIVDLFPPERTVGKKKNCINLFPGYDDNGVHRKLGESGRLR